MKISKAMVKKISIIIILMGSMLPSFGQIISQGKIQFERKINIKQQVQTETGNEFMKSMIDKMSPFEVSLFSLSFNQNESQYLFEKKLEQKGFSISNLASENKIWMQLDQNKLMAQKNLFESKYWIEDSIPHYKWKIEDEMRTIAGYLCRKAITRIDDSVVVVAFYTDQIMVSSGPESFCGLPGMILGLAIPRLYTTWFATEVQLGKQVLEPLTPERKSKLVNREEYVNDMRNSTKSWGKNSAKAMWWAML